MVNVWVIPLAAIGLAITIYITYVTLKNKNMICIRGKDCDAVVTSKYNKTFGISNIYAGLLYYSLVIVLAIFLLMGITQILFLPLELFLLIIAGGAALFSLYLTFIQAFVLKIWCEYCVTSAVVSILIFILELIPLF